MKISATILLKGDPIHFQKVLSALEPLDEVLIFNNGGGRATLDSLNHFKNVRVVEGVFSGFGPTHNAASELAKNDWILSVDSDEVATNALITEIMALSLDDATVYSIPRRNFYQGKWIRGCGWWPDHALRLYNKKTTQFTNVQVHESIQTKGMHIVTLKNWLEHYSYTSASDFLTKMQSYSDLFAKEWTGKKQSSPCKAALHGAFAFFKSYILKLGIRGGYEGYLISKYNGHTAFYKYIKLYESNSSKK